MTTQATSQALTSGSASQISTSSSDLSDSISAYAKQIGNVVKNDDSWDNVSSVSDDSAQQCIVGYSNTCDNVGLPVGSKTFDPTVSTTFLGQSIKGIEIPSGVAVSVTKKTGTSKDVNGKCQMTLPAPCSNLGLSMPEISITPAPASDAVSSVSSASSVLSQQSVAQSVKIGVPPGQTTPVAVVTTDSGTVVVPANLIANAVSDFTSSAQAVSSSTPLVSSSTPVVSSPGSVQSINLSGVPASGDISFTGTSSEPFSVDNKGVSFTYTDLLVIVIVIAAILLYMFYGRDNSEQ